MGKRFYIHVGDTTTSAGKVLTGLTTRTWHGIPNAFDGDAIECPKCHSIGQIRVVGSRISSVGSHGRQRALSGDLCLCKCCPQISGSSYATKQLARRWRIVYTG